MPARGPHGFVSPTSKIEFDFKSFSNFLAQVGGPDRFDGYIEERWRSATRVTLHDNVGFLGSLAGLSHTKTILRSCESYHGVFQKYVQGQGKF